MPPEEVASFDRPFARNRALRLISAALLGAALRLTAPELARAADGPAPWPCSGAGTCHCCSGSTCCEQPCTADTAHCSSGGQCWYVCTGTGDVYRCCDWHDPSGNLCICPEWVPITC